MNNDIGQGRPGRAEERTAASRRDAKLSASGVQVALCALIFFTRPGDGAEPAPREKPASDYIEVKLDGNCDPSNGRMYIRNGHNFKTIKIELRWRAVDRFQDDQTTVTKEGKWRHQEFFLPPDTNFQEVACASEWVVDEASYMDF